MEALSRADRAAPLAPGDLELLATAAYMRGEEDEWMHALERACQGHADAGNSRRAARCAFWIGIQLALRGEVGPAGGWLGRAQRLVDKEDGECVEQGYLLIPVSFQHEAEGDWEGAAATVAAAAEIGDRFGDADLFALATHAEGDILVRYGRVPEGLRLLDQAMVTVTTEAISPVVSGIVYCGVILACEEIFELRRAREWTAALARWWEGQPELIAFTGRCLVHRAQLMRLQGAWDDALQETERARRSFESATNRAAAAKAQYLQGDVHRLRGEFPEAEDAYRRANELGLEPQPGWALMRLAQGDPDAAAASLRRALAETGSPLRRAGLLPAQIEVAVALGNIDEARTALRELEQTCAETDTEMLRAMLAQARGAVELAAGDAPAALAGLRETTTLWQELEAPYEAARARVLLGQACRALDDEDTFELELAAARSAFEELRAAPDLAAADTLLGSGSADGEHGLSARELEVLRLLATGKSNRDIAAALVISEHTVARHVQNIFAKLRVGSRTAAGAYAFEHGLV